MVFCEYVIQHDQGFCKTYSFRIFVPERKYKSNLKNHESQKYFTILI